MVTRLGSLWLLSLLSFLQPVEARLDKIPGSRYTSGRAAALGDAYIPLADDGASGLFYNPAGLGLIQRSHAEPLNLQIHVNNAYVDQFSLNFFKAFDLPGYSPTLQSNPNTGPGVGAAIFPNFYMRGIAFGVLGQSKVSAYYDGSQIHYRSLYQLIPTIGGALRLARGIVRIGYSLQWIQQASGERSVDPTDANLGYTDSIKAGSAFSHTIGFGLTIPGVFLPSLNVVARNVLGTKFSSSTFLPISTTNSTGAPDEEPMSIDLAFSLHPKAGRGGVGNIVFELRDALNTSGFSLLKRAAAGLELSFRDRFFLRGGYSGLYPHAGIGIRSPTAEFALSWFSEEVGTADNNARELKYMMQYQIRAF